MHTGERAVCRCRQTSCEAEIKTVQSVGPKHLDVRIALGRAGEGPVLGLHVEVAESEGQAHCIEAQQLRSVHYRGKIAAQRCVIRPQILHECRSIFKASPGESLRVTSLRRAHAC